MADKPQTSPPGASTHFGFRTVDSGQKAGLVRGVFDSVASKYDVMNDLMSFGIHRLWKRRAVELSGVRRGQRVLDLAAGTGDLAARFAGLVGDEGLVVLGFPSNDFFGQEPGTEEEIQEFCRLTYSVKFPMFAKTQVRKGNADPLFQCLGEAAGCYPQWNFHKYLIGRDGRLVDNYLSFTSPQSETIVNAVEELL